MNIIAPSRLFIWRFDPGYCNLKQAFRTIFAILLALWIVEDESLLTKLLAGIACGVSIQGVVAKTMRLRLLHVFLFTIIYIAVFFLGLLVRDSPSLTSITLIVLGFGVNYIRRFGLQNSLAPLMIWLLCFLATIIPFSPVEVGWGPVYGAFVGFAVSIWFVLFFFPDNYPRLFINNSNLFFSTLSDGLQEMRRNLLMSSSKKMPFKTMPFVKLRLTLIQLLTTNQTIQYSKVFAEEDDLLEYIVTHQYALLNAYTLLMDAYRALFKNPEALTPKMRLALSILCRAYARLFDKIIITSKFQVEKKGWLGTIPNLSKRLQLNSPTPDEVVMMLLNFKLGFDLLNQHANALLRNFNDD